MPVLNNADHLFLGATKVDAVYLGVTKVWSVPIVTAPTNTLMVSFAPKPERNDVTGEVGGLLTFASNASFTWLGLRCGTGNTGLRQVSLYEYNADALIARGMVDLTGKAVGTYGWVKIAPFTVLAGNTYALVLQITQGGQVWSDIGPTAFKSPVSAVAGVYRLGTGGLTGATADQQYAGLDLGWDA
jgi:hypothetical protein